MKAKEQTLDIFHAFAGKELENHKRELETRYQGRELSSTALLEEAYRKQRELFGEELSEKIEELSDNGDQFLRASLWELKEEYLDRLSPPVY
jgi:hypothetical protein